MPDVPPEFQQAARDLDLRGSIPPQEYEALKATCTELATRTGYDRSCIVLGSYEAQNKPKLLEVASIIERSDQGDCRADLLEDFDDDLDAILQFQLVADHSDAVVGICEHDRGGFQLELGIALTKYFDICHVLKRSYPAETEREVYNFMLSMSVFELLDRAGRLREWTNDDELRTQTRELTGDLLDQ